ncbi:glycoside hydrolase family 3 C-terminal domain-containing protein [Haloferula sargassicola]
MVVSLASTGIAPAQTYKDSKAPLEERVEDLFSRLTPDEKLSLLSGGGFNTQPIPRLDVPPMVMVDAGQGVRGGPDSLFGPATAFPSGVAMGSTWDPELISRVGAAIGTETRNKGTGAQILLGPAVNIHRSPLGGRNGEYFSEDPVVSARLGVAYIQGMQGVGTVACIKHFAANNEEVDRGDVDVRMDERTLREIYLPAFEAGVKEGGVWTLMTAYNKVNGPHASANTYLLRNVLKDGWGFDGLVMSDWGGVHETPVSQAGNDLEMPGGGLATPDKLKVALEDKSLTQDAVDDSARRVLRTVIRAGLLDGPIERDAGKVNSEEHRKLAYEVATKSIVLLKNENQVLPLDRNRIRSVAVIGEPAEKLQIGALGSPEVKPLKTVQIIDGFRETAGKNVTVRFAAGRINGNPVSDAVVHVPGDPNSPGFAAEYFTNTNLEGEPALKRVEAEVQLNGGESPAPGIGGSNYSVRWSGVLTPPETGEYTFYFTGDDGFRVFVDDQQIMDRWSIGGAAIYNGKIKLEKSHPVNLRVEFFQGGGNAMAELNWMPPSFTIYSDAVAAAKASDAAVVAVSTWRTEGEGSDRPSMDLPNGQADLIRAVAAVNKNTIVVINSGTPVTLKDWVDQVPAVLQAWFPGQEGGAAIADIIFGDVNPSGRLPDTFAANREDYPDYGNFPGTNGTVKYEEGIYVGYRHFDKKGIEPIFPFGHGLSYTTFAFKNAKAQSTGGEKGHPSVRVTVEVTNTGRRQGEEVVQLYIHDPNPQIDKPVRELKGFQRIALKPGESGTVTFNLTPRDFSYFDVAGKQWRADPGTYDIEIGASSRDIRLKVPLKIRDAVTEKVPLSKNFAPN